MHPPEIRWWKQHPSRAGGKVCFVWLCVFHYPLWPLNINKGAEVGRQRELRVRRHVQKPNHHHHQLPEVIQSPGPLCVYVSDVALRFQTPGLHLPDALIGLFRRG